MRVTARQRSIVEFLLEEQKEVTVGTIAGHIGVSARTVHRELDAIEPIVTEHGLALVRKAGAGVELQGTDEQKQALREAVLYRHVAMDFTAHERKIMILCSLLEATEPVKLISLAIDLKVTTATISHDLDDLETMLARYELSLLRKRGYGVELQGTESAKRRAISRLISENLDEHELIGLIKANIQNKALPDIDSVSERLLGLIDKDKLIRVELALKHIGEDLHYPLADSAYLGLVTHLALAVERVEKGESILFDEQTLAELEGTPEYEAAENIIDRLQQMFGLEMPKAEIGYITMHLRGAKLRSSPEAAMWPENAELLAATQRLIQFFAERLGMPLKEDHSLFHGLLTHLEPALYRLKRNMGIRNPILDQIKTNYPDLFAVGKEAVAQVFPHLNVPDEEIGYLVMHVGAAVERTIQENKRYRALVVCSSGIGSSKILAIRIKKELPEIISLQNLSMFEVGRIPKSEYDVIISTIPLPLAEHDYLVVSPLLPQEDIQKIKFYLHSLDQAHVVQAKPEKGATKAGQEPLMRLNAMHRYAGYAVEIVDGLAIHSWGNDGESLEKTLLRMCEQLSRDGAILQPAGVARQLLQREKLGGLGIPETSMALFHGKNQEVTRTSFTVHRLSAPLRLKSMNEEEMSVDTLLLLLGPEDVPREGLEVLSEISSMLIESDMLDVLKSEDPQPLADYIAGKLYAFCRKKIGLERVH
ncbi:BglG family transcription antiterminator [Brevibacillus fluminis]|uniref:BglG family transcription antiterminator n=1 Tax=Brevibacillus fluminis TaxID=511487 RepID=UPI003F898BF4